MKNTFGAAAAVVVSGENISVFRDVLMWLDTHAHARLLVLP